MPNLCGIQSVVIAPSPTTAPAKAGASTHQPRDTAHPSQPPPQWGEERPPQSPPHAKPINPALPPPTWGGVGVGGNTRKSSLRPPTPTQGRARPRDGAPPQVLGTLPLNPSRRSSAGNIANAPSRREVGRGPAALCALIPGGRGSANLTALLPTPTILPSLPPVGRGRGGGPTREKAALDHQPHPRAAPDLGMAHHRQF